MAGGVQSSQNKGVTPYIYRFDYSSSGYTITKPKQGATYYIQILFNDYGVRDSSRSCTIIPGTCPVALSSSKSVSYDIVEFSFWDYVATNKSASITISETNTTITLSDFSMTDTAPTVLIWEA